MRYFATGRQLWKALVSDLLTMGNKVPSRNGDTREIVGWTGYLSTPQDAWAGDARKASLGYAFAELLWYFRGERAVSPMLTAYAPSYERFTNDGDAMGAYGDRWLDNPGIRRKGGWSPEDPHGSEATSSLYHAVELLRSNPDDRRAVVSFWDSGDVVEARRGVWKDIPCTLTMQFLVRGKSLHCSVNMRSNDAWLGGVYDIFCFTQIQCLVAASLGLTPGTYVHHVGSMHLYEKNADGALQAVADVPPGDFSAPIPMPTKQDADELLRMSGNSKVLVAEEVLREHGYSALANYYDVCGEMSPWGSRVITELGQHLHSMSLKRKP